MNPFSIIADLATLIVEVNEENYEIENKRIENKRRQHQEKKNKEYEEYFKKWKKATEEEYKNPDDWRVLPYGWSPFGIIL